MATITETITAAQDQVLDVLKKVQEPTVEAVRTVVEKIDEYLPADRPAVPFAENLPQPAELVELSFSFAQKLLDNQHEFAKSLVDAFAPLVPEAPKAKKAPVAKAKPAAA